jgi:ethanolamine utilization cobalamin adenosyltransferase
MLEHVRSVLKYFSTKTKQPVQANVNEEVDMTPEEVQAIVTKALEATNASLAAVQAENEKLKADVLAANAAIQANAESGLKDKRAAVAAVHGEVVANALAGEALDAMFASVQTAAGILPGAPATNADEFKIPSMADHFGGAK